jgi:cyclic pyranopterin phosphate synthase
MPEEGVTNLGHNKILSLEEMARLVKIAVGIGIRKVRLTGGEPLVRRNIAQLIRYISSLPEIDDIAITTNGVLFSAMAAELKDAGLNRANISLDTLDAEKFKYITRRDHFSEVKQAIYRAMEMDMHPVKINTVVMKGFNDDEILDFAELACKYPLHIRFIEFMPIGDLLFFQKDRMLDTGTIKKMIEEKYTLFPGKKQIKGNGPAKYFLLEGGQGSVGFISPMSNHFCGECNRIRMTAEGGLRGCLYDRREVNLRDALTNGASDEEIQELFIRAIKMKPARHNMNSGWGEENKRKMYQIGG